MGKFYLMYFASFCKLACNCHQHNWLLIVLLDLLEYMAICFKDLIVILKNICVDGIYMLICSIVKHSVMAKM
jgi:hypothetical protein